MTAKKNSQPEVICGSCLSEDWDWQVEQIKATLGESAYIKVHGEMDNQLIFTALMMERK